MAQTPGVGLVGCGRWGRHILRDLVALGCRVEVVAPDTASRRRAEQGGATLVLDSVDALSDLDGYVVATPATSHAEVVARLLPRAAPVFVEKPLTVDRASAAHLAAAAPDRLFVMDKWRYHTGVGRLASIARGGELGDILGLETERLQWGHAHDDVDGIWTLAPHDLSIALEILGHLPAPRAAVAEQTEGLPTHMVALLGTDPWHVLCVSVRSKARRRRIRLRCEGGLAEFSDGPTPHLTLLPNGAPEGSAGETLPLAPDPPLRRELEAFVAHLGGGPPPRSSAAEGAAAVDTLVTLRELAGLPISPVGFPRDGSR